MLDSIAVCAIGLAIAVLEAESLVQPVCRVVSVKHAVSMIPLVVDMPSRMGAGLPNIAEDSTAPMDIETHGRPAKNLSRNGMSFGATAMATSPPVGASPVNSLMTAMEAKCARNPENKPFQHP